MNSLQLRQIYKKQRTFYQQLKKQQKTGNNYTNIEKALFISAPYENKQSNRLDQIFEDVMIKAFFEAEVHDPRKIKENGKVI